MQQLDALRETVELAEKAGMPLLPDSSLGLAHLREMRTAVEADPSRFSAAKLGRWLGWAQAAVVAADVGLGLEDMKRVNVRHAD